MQIEVNKGFNLSKANLRKNAIKLIRLDRKRRRLAFKPEFATSHSTEMLRKGAGFVREFCQEFKKSFGERGKKLIVKGVVVGSSVKGVASERSDFDFGIVYFDPGWRAPNNFLYDHRHFEEVFKEASRLAKKHGLNISHVPLFALNLNRLIYLIEKVGKKLTEKNYVKPLKKAWISDPNSFSFAMHSGHAMDMMAGLNQLFQSSIAGSLVNERKMILNALKKTGYGKQIWNHFVEWSWRPGSSDDIRIGYEMVERDGKRFKIETRRPPISERIASRVREYYKDLSDEEKLKIIESTKGGNLRSFPIVCKMYGVE